jgi:mono/diheme cytochrome c family protein
MSGIVAVIILAVLFTGISIAVAYGASKGSFKAVGNALQATNRSGSRMFNTVLVVVYVGVGIAVPLVFIIGNHDNSNAQAGGVKLTAAMQSGRDLFAEHCAVCHTLAATNAVGKVGPNLDQLKPPASLVLHTIANGCLQKLVGKQYNSICLGYGNMPADIVQGQDAVDVAKFVAAVAGHG